MNEPFTFLDRLHALTEALLPKHSADLLAPRINSYYALMQKWGKVYNLTADFAPSAWLPHVADSVATGALVHGLQQKHGISRVADIGSGAGFPAMISAMINPAIHWTLFEIDHNKSAFLRQAAIVLNLPNIRVEADFHNIVYHRLPFQFISSKAFLPLEVFLQTLPNLLPAGGFGSICSHYQSTPSPTIIDTKKAEKKSQNALGKTHQMGLPLLQSRLIYPCPQTPIAEQKMCLLSTPWDSRQILLFQV